MMARLGSGILVLVALAGITTAQVDATAQLARLRDEQPAVRLAALTALADASPTDEIVQAVARSLGDRDPSVGIAAVASLLRLRKDFAPLDPTLRSIVHSRGSLGEPWGWLHQPNLDCDVIARRLDDPDAGVRAKAVEQLCGQFGAAQPYRDRLLALRGDASLLVRRALLRNLCLIGQDAELRGFVIAALKDADATVREAAASGLFLVNGDGEGEVVRALRGAVQDPVASVRAAVVTSLGFYPKAVSRSGPEITALLSDREPVVRAAAAEAVRQLGLRDARAMRETMRLLDDGDDEVLQSALKAIASMGADGAGSLDRVMAFTRDARPGIRSISLWAALGVVPDEKKGAVVLRLVEALAFDDDPEVRNNAEVCLKHFVAGR